MATRKKNAPKTLGACVDRLYELKHEIAEMNKQVAALKSERYELKERLIAELPASEAMGIAGKAASATIVIKPKPTVGDWEKFYAYIKRRNAFHLLQRRVSEPAIRELWEDNKAVPGVEVFQDKDVSLKKL